MMSAGDNSRHRSEKLFTFDCFHRVRHQTQVRVVLSGAGHTDYVMVISAEHHGQTCFDRKLVRKASHATRCLQCPSVSQDMRWSAAFVLCVLVWPEVQGRPGSLVGDKGIQTSQRPPASATATEEDDPRNTEDISPTTEEVQGTTTEDGNKTGLFHGKIQKRRSVSLSLLVGGVPVSSGLYAAKVAKCKDNQPLTLEHCLPILTRLLETGFGSFGSR
ncbi:hypothetical protein J6590_016375 [Homalodisca vitripennis]|nr:hypothetical protein J6590_016375 [Homalodisca vitripennis]